MPSKTLCDTFVRHNSDDFAGSKSVLLNIINRLNFVIKMKGNKMYLHGSGSSVTEGIPKM